MGPRLTAAAAAALVPLPASAEAADPFGHACVPRHGVRFCPTADLAQRGPSFDGTPLDVGVTLPPTGTGPFPTIAMEHGYPGTKQTFQAIATKGTGGSTYRYNDLFYARQGYAVVTPSARGFGRSCGSPESRTAGCERGWTHIADQRFEERDVQTLLGMLVDEGVAKPDALGVTGVSGGGGRSISLAFLRDRIRLPDGSFAPWTSPESGKVTVQAQKATRLLGSPVVEARVRTRGAGGQLAARLWVVRGKRQRLISRGLDRLTPNETRRVRFELHPNAYRVAEGRRLKLELLGRDAPYAQAPERRFRVTVGRLRLTLPTRERGTRGFAR